MSVLKRTLKLVLNKILSSLVNKKRHTKPESKPESLKVVPASKPVIALKQKLKKAENTSSGKNIPVYDDNFYITFVEYIKKNSVNQKLPSTKQIELDLNITKLERLKLSKRALEENVLTKDNGTYKLNINQ